MQKIKEVNGIEIYVEDDGKFSATIEKKVIKRSTLSAIEKLISERQSAIELLDLSRDWNKCPVIVQIRSFENGRARSKDGKLYGKYDHFYHATAEQVKLAEDIHKRQMAINNEWDKLKESLLQVDSKNFEKISQKMAGS